MAGKTDLKTMDIPAGLDVMEDGKPFFYEGGKVGCLLIHGFTGTTSSMEPMGRYLADRGVTALGPRLPGHGTDVEDMGRWSHQDWISTVSLALDEISEICETVFVTGLSMGGMLTLYLGERFPDRIAGLMPVSAPVVRLAPGAQRYALYLVPLLKHVVKAMPGPGGDLKDPSVKEVAYEKLSTAALHELVKLGGVVAGELGRITSPIRVFHSREDHVVPPLNAQYIIDHVGSADKELIWLENSYHVATLDYDSEKIFEDSYTFMSKLTG